MRKSQPRTRKSPKPGLRALEACGDGFWEFDLLDSSAWFSDWFYRKLNWPTDAKRTTLLALQPLLQPTTWQELMRKFRDHLEQGLPLDLKLRIQVAGKQFEWWHLRGAAQRNAAGQPIYLAGSMCDVSADRMQPEVSSSLLRLRDAFDALPVAAALLDAHHNVLDANRRWSELVAHDSAQVISRLREATAQNSQTAIELLLDQDAGSNTSGSLRIRAVPFQYSESRHLAVTLENL
jgi:PAS domain-containing protein